MSKDLYDSMLGVDHMLMNAMRRELPNPPYPVYNLYHEHDTSTSVIEIDVAGFKTDELDLELDNNTLTIKGSRVTKVDREKRKYITNRLAQRDFTLRFAVAPYTQISSRHEDGILTVECVVRVPDELKPRKIPINRAEALQAPDS